MSQPRKKLEAAPSPPDGELVRLTLSPSDKARLRSIAGANNMTMCGFVRSLVLDTIQAWEDKNGRKA